MNGPQSAIKSITDEIRCKAVELPPEEFLEYVDILVEAFKRHVESISDDKTRNEIREIYRDIVGYALTCQLTANAPKEPGFSGLTISASC